MHPPRFSVALQCKELRKTTVLSSENIWAIDQFSIVFLSKNLLFSLYKVTNIVAMKSSCFTLKKIAVSCP